MQWPQLDSEADRATTIPARRIFFALFASAVAYVRVSVSAVASAVDFWTWIFLVVEQPFSQKRACTDPPAYLRVSVSAVASVDFWIFLVVEQPLSQKRAKGCTDPPALHADHTPKAVSLAKHAPEASSPS